MPFNLVRGFVVVELQDITLSKFSWTQTKSDFELFVDVLFVEYQIEKKQYNETPTDKETWLQDNKDYIKKQYEQFGKRQNIRRFVLRCFA